MSDVLIISTPGNTAQRLYSMSEVGSLQAVLQLKGYKTEVIDCIYYGDNFKRILKKAKDENPCLICIVLQWEHQPFMKWTQELMKEIKRLNLEAQITAVGRGATVCSEHILNNYDFFDTIIRGESEKTVVELFDKVQKSADLLSQRGIVFKTNGKVIFNEFQEPVFDLDSLPFADREYLKDRKLYPIAPMHSSRYCYGSCNFCVNKIYRNTTPCNIYRARSADSVVEELISVKHKYGVRTFCFVDNNFFVDGKKGKQRAIKIAEKLIKNEIKIRFHIESRVNDVDADTFRLLKKAGLRKVFLGIESGSQRVLDRFQKETTVEMNKKAIHILKNLEISWEPGFIMFDPLTTMDELRENYEFIVETELHKCKSSTGSKLFHPLTIYPGAPILKKIPSEAITTLFNNIGEISYKILDEKADAVQNLIRLCQKTIDRQEQTYTQINNFLLVRATRKIKENDQQDREYRKNHVDFQKRMAQWKENKPGLDMKIFKTIIDQLDELETANDKSLKELEETIKNKITDYHVKYFDATFNDYMKTIHTKFDLKN
jgi:anaerobic magnesium-protoporphyrin IX monomethyl ester cyclase